uniref:Uncharacterized LOC100175402 n=1 Tax=Ciona intestinalis TaxID=7719 RepID=H2XTD1_CIOIN|nr:uncharacterized protein LOC100175402 [Ciona intestinalis]|eukprot:XP_002129609.1 uncharacterized protein LOC100175402 [Ciona intestinalis]
MDIIGYHELSRKIQRRGTAGFCGSRVCSLVCVSGIALAFILALCSFAGYKSRLQTLEDEMENLHEIMNNKLGGGLHRAKRSVEASNQGGPSPVALTEAAASGGAPYIRWGRKSCSQEAGSQLVYTGFAAGSHYTHNGGGPNLICIHQNITYTRGKYVNGFQGSSYIYGVEYRDGAWADSLFDFSLIEDEHYRLHAVPCSLCLATGRQNKVMIPGREECPTGFTFEYGGYVVSSAHGHKHSTDYICLDDTPEVIRGSDGDQGGDLLYIVETQCPSLPCDPVVNGRELRCVVCSI